MFVKRLPNFPVLLLGCYEVADFSGALVFPHRVCGKKQTADDADGLKQIEPMFCEPS